jgi:hypothetical protein
MPTTEWGRIFRFAWTEPKQQASSEHRLLLPPLLSNEPGPEPIDFDWWEPTTEWRRENARWREQFGGAKFGKAQAPVEGPNNPNRLRRELAEAESSQLKALRALKETEDDLLRANEALARVGQRVAARARR